MAVTKNLVVRIGIKADEYQNGVKSVAKETEKAFSGIGKNDGLNNGIASFSKNAKKELQTVRDQIGQLEAYEKSLSTKLEEIWQSDGEGARFEGVAKAIDNVRSKIAQLQGRGAVLEVQVDTEEAEQGVSRVERLKSVLKGFASGAAAMVGGVVVGAFKALGFAIKSLPNVASVAFRGIRLALKPVTSGISAMANGIKRVAGTYLGLGLVTSVLGRMRSVVSSVISENAALKAQTEQLKAGFASALAPAINLVANALSALMPYIIGVSNAISSLITNLFGTGWTTAAGGANELAAATGGAAAAQEELNRQLAGFDEITKLNSRKSSSGGGGGGGSSTVTNPIEGQMPRWLTDISASITAAIQNDDWSIVGYTIAEKLEGVFATAHNWFVNTDFSAIGKGLAQGINGSVSKFLETDAVGIGTLISDYLSAGIKGIKGFSEELDWANVGRLVVKEVSDFFKNFDWAAAFETVGSLTVGILSAIVQPLKDGFEKFTDYFGDSIEKAGGNLWAGIVNGVKNAVVNVGTWIKDNVVVPFVNGFNSAFGIHSPASEPSLLEAAGYVGQGILNGIAAPFEAIGAWCKTHILDPITNFFKGNTEKPAISVTVDDSDTARSGWWKKVGDAWTAVKKALIFDAAPASGGTARSGWWKKVSDAWTAVKTALIFDAAPASGGTARNGWWTKVSDAWSAVKTALTFDAAPASGGTARKSWWTKVSDAWTAVKTALTFDAAPASGGTARSSWWNSVKTAWDEKIASLTSSPLFNVAVNDSSGERSDWWTTVKNGWATFMAGITSYPKFKSAVDASDSEAKSWWQKVKDAFNNAKGTVSFKATADYSDSGSGYASTGRVISRAASTGAITHSKQLAVGGFVTTSKMSYATAGGQSLTIGESGREAVLPLDNNTAWIDSLAERIARRQNTEPIEITIPLILDGQVVGRTAVSYINGQAVATGVNPLAAYL